MKLFLKEWKINKNKKASIQYSLSRKFVYLFSRRNSFSIKRGSRVAIKRRINELKEKKKENIESKRSCRKIEGKRSQRVIND